SDMPWYFEIKQAEPEHVLETRREIEKLELMLDHYGFSALLLEDNEADKLFQSILLDTILDDVFPTVDELHELEVSRDAVRSDLERRLHA
ncbi:MAG TPA: hypothetical protein VMU11_01200, partial [Verrucomicrobiae bacterium]|nr:hypothetical protein [Verrucomicrobiae bacterium]